MNRMNAFIWKDLKKRISLPIWGRSEKAAAHKAGSEPSPDLAPDLRLPASRTVKGTNCLVYKLPGLWYLLQAAWAKTGSQWQKGPDTDLQDRSVTRSWNLPWKRKAYSLWGQIITFFTLEGQQSCLLTSKHIFTFKGQRLSLLHRFYFCHTHNVDF